MPAGYPPTMAPPMPAGAGGGWVSRVVDSALVAWIVAAVLAATVIGLSVGLATSGSSNVAPLLPPQVRPVLPFGPGGFGGNPSKLGAVTGTVASVGTNSFTVTTGSGQTVTVDEQSSTVYSNGSASASASAVTQGAHVFVEGNRNGNTITATRVVILPF